MLEIGTCHFGSIIEGKKVVKAGLREISVHHPYNHEVIGKFSCATTEDATQAVISSHRVYTKIMKKMPARKRSEILRKMANLVESETDQLAYFLSLETGKPLKTNRLEVAHAIAVLRCAAEGVKTIYEERMPLNRASEKMTQMGITKRISLGVVGVFTSFNLPFNLLLHQLASVIAAGNTVILQPPEKAVLSFAFLYRLFENSGLPKGVINIVMGTDENLARMITAHPKTKYVIFSDNDSLKTYGTSNRKKVILAHDYTTLHMVFRDADLDTAVHAAAIGGFTHVDAAYTSVQQIYVEREIYLAFLEKLTQKVKSLKIGNPLDEKIDVGPMITEQAAEQAETRVREMLEQGATLSAGGYRKGAFMEATIISDVSIKLKQHSTDRFAPVINIIPFSAEKEMINHINESNCCSRAVVFTTDIKRVMHLGNVLKPKKVYINEGTGDKRIDCFDDSVNTKAVLKEEIISAIKEMTEVKFISTGF